jgi:hypothetical protein
MPNPGGFMRKLVFILLAFIAVATFIRAYDNAGTASPRQWERGSE